MTTAEAAEEVGMSRSMIYILARKRLLPTCRIGRRILVRAEDLERFIHDRMSRSPHGET
jgi:excisionase family DNA binding protein